MNRYFPDDRLPTSLPLTPFGVLAVLQDLLSRHQAMSVTLPLGQFGAQTEHHVVFNVF